MVAKNKDWLLAVSKEEIGKKLAEFAKKYPNLENRFILAETNQRKLQNALASYVQLETGEEAIILYDDTLLGGARDGFVVTNKNVYIHNMFSETIKLPIRNIRTFGVKETDILIDLNSVSTAMANDDSRKDMVSLLKDIIPVGYAAKDSKKSESAKQKKSRHKKTSENKPKSDSSDDKDVREYNFFPKHKTLQSETFKGFLYDDYGIDENTSLEESLSILKSQGFDLMDERKHFSTLSVIYMNNSYEEQLTLYGIRYRTIMLAVNENDMCYGHIITFPRTAQNGCNKPF